MSQIINIAKCAVKIFFTNPVYDQTFDIFLAGHLLTVWVDSVAVKKGRDKDIT